MEKKTARAQFLQRYQSLRKIKKNNMRAKAQMLLLIKNF